MTGATKRVPLTVQETAGIDRVAWPITQGVPFADGELRRGAPVSVVDEDGHRLPTQATCLATWNRDCAWAKWLLVDFACDLAAGETRRLFLEYGDGVATPAPERPITVVREGRRTRIDTGTLRLDLRHGSADFLAACSVHGSGGWRDVLRGAPGPHLYLTGTDGTTYNSITPALPPRITIEDEGPLRVSVAIAGYHADARGIRLCPYTVRIHLYAGKDFLRLFHTFVFDQNPDALEFSGVGLRFPLDLGDDPRVAFGGDGGTRWARRWTDARLLQTSDTAYEITRDGEQFGSGEKARGWASLCGSEASAQVVVRDFWQQYPKGLALSPTGIDVQLWPSSSGKQLVYSTPWKERPVFFGGTRDEEEVKRLLAEKPTAPLNLKSFAPKTIEDVLWVEKMADTYAPDRPATHNDIDVPADGTGAAKTHEVVLRFSAEAIADADAEALCRSVQEAVIAPADPAYMAATGATRGIFGGPDDRFAELDGLLGGIVERVAIEPMEIARLWGFWRFGNMCCSHAAGPVLAYQAYHDTDPAKGLRFVGPYNNEADDPVWGLWTQFLRTGSPRFFRVASGFSRAMGDVGICHAHPSRPEVVGLVHYHSGHQWTGGHSHSHTLNTALFLHYYLTGDRRMREIALEVADNAVRNQETAGIISNRRGRLNREYTGPLVCVIEAYLDTWAATYGDLARRSLNWLLRAQSRPGIFPISVYTRGARGGEALVEPSDEPLHHAGIVYPIFYEGLRHFDSPLLRETIIAEADHVIARDEGGHVATACSLAYELTGDAIYAALCGEHLERYKAQARTSVGLTNIALFSSIRNGYIGVLKTTVARAMAAGPAGFEEAKRALAARLGSDTSARAPMQAVPVEVNLGIPVRYEE